MSPLGEDVSIDGLAGVARRRAEGDQAMAGVDEVLERLVTDQAFRTALRDDPVGALDGYDLQEEDLAVLAATLAEGQGSDHDVEQRTSKSALLGLFVGLAGDGEGAQAAAEDLVAASRPEPGLNVYAELTANGTALRHGSEVPIESLVIENEGVDGSAGDSVEGNETETFGASRDATVEGRGGSGGSVSDPTQPLEQHNQSDLDFVSRAAEVPVDDLHAGPPETDQPVVIGSVYNPGTDPSPSAYDDSHEVEMDVHVGRPEPEERISSNFGKVSSDETGAGDLEDQAADEDAP
jgi:hypothetical protein